ncbi:MAG: PIN domain nuclease [Bacteroidetes bacterium]|nr:PIN domain nuclease [Bacteroidota bacterium]MBU2584491.1 PIN domain nuclease [Bacteroidota bacterium]
MPRKIKLYLDTSVPNAYFDEKNPHRKEITEQFWLKLKEHEVFISDLVIKEMEATGDEELREKLIKLVKGFENLSTKSEEIKGVAEEYVLRGIIPVKHIEDAIHIAVTTINSLDVLVSWNFEHIVKLKTKREVNAVNVLLGYNPIEIIDPAMI